jgi:hypothetical protein
MIYKTKVINKSGVEISRLSGLNELKYQFHLGIGASIVIPSRDPLSIYARYEEIIFERGESEYKQQPGSNVVTEVIYPGPIRLKIRKNWEEPKRNFPVVNFLNISGAGLEVYYPDCFNPGGAKLLLPLGVPVLCSVPVYSPLAQYKEFRIFKDEHDSELGESFPHHEMKGKRSQQELDRLARMLADWKESEKNRIKVL